MFTVQFYNFGFNKFADSAEDALELAEGSGFQCTIYWPSGEPLASYCPMRGLTMWKVREEDVAV